MEPDRAAAFIQSLAARHRVLMLGGMAVIAYGLDRKTKDVDVWLEPFDSPSAWSAALVKVLADFPRALLWSLASHSVIAAGELPCEIEASRVVRITGLDRDVDLFREPNELQTDDFDAAWSRASRSFSDGVRLPDELTLYLTKTNTGRERDLHDLIFLESLIKKRFRPQLAACDAATARRLFDQFSDPEVLSYALINPEVEVRNLALGLLTEFESEGDPFSRDILARWRAEHPAG